MIISCDNIDIREDFLKGFWRPNFSMYFELLFFPIKFFSRSNNLEAHMSSLSFP